MSTLKIGTTYGGLATFESRGISAPTAHPVVGYSSLEKMASGIVVARGFPVSMLQWLGQLTTAERIALRTLIPGWSASLYVQVPNERYVDTIYTCVALWPERTPENSHIPSFNLTLTRLVVATS